MFIIYCLKVLIMIVVYLSFLFSLSTIILYVCQTISPQKFRRTTTGVSKIAKAIVFTTNLIVFTFSVIAISMTFDWQKSLLYSVKETAMQQPIFAILVIILIIWPIMYIRKLASEQS
jgi:hypothetical protein